MIEAKKISVSIGKKTILNSVSFRLKPHTLTVVVGKNGSGKSTLVSCFAQTKEYTGELLYSGRNILLMPPKERASKIAILPQMLKAPHIHVNELVKMGRNPYLDLAYHMTESDCRAVEEAMNWTSVKHLEASFVDELSGGEKQKVYLALILAQDTRVLILDEPTTYMDVNVEADFLKILVKLKNEKKKTLLVIMHNLNHAVQIADQIIVMDQGQIVFEGSKEECLEKEILENSFHVKRYESEGRLFFESF